MSPTPNLPAINGDLSRRAMMNGNDIEWQPSPSGTVWRKRLHLVGSAEAGQVTSIVRYEPGSSFPQHDHPEGEEILVLEGVFSDEHGDWPAGTYLLNPEGFRHAPFSQEGCLIFVKLRQYGGQGRHHVVIDTKAETWHPGGHPGVEIQNLYQDPGFPEVMRLERWAPGTLLEPMTHKHGIEFLVLKGAFADENGHYQAQTWLRLPPNSSHQPRSDQGCVLYVKSGAVSSLRSA